MSQQLQPQEQCVGKNEPSDKQTGSDATAGRGHVQGLQISELAQMPPKTILDATRLSEIVGVSPRSLRRMVGRFELPPSIPFGGHSVWLAGKVLEHIEAAAETAQKKAERQTRRISELVP